MELAGAILGLETLKERCAVTMYTDSRYVVDGFAKGWAAGWKARGWKRSGGEPALNPDLWERLLAAAGRHKVEFVWIKGHSEQVPTAAHLRALFF
jgi:ribonuclease HI